FVPADTPYFYWLIPESAERGALGLIGEVGSEARKHLEAFLVKRNLEPLAFQGARIPVYTRWVPVRKKLAGGEVFLVGDAADKVEVSTVGDVVRPGLLDEDLDQAAGVQVQRHRRSSRTTAAAVRRDVFGGRAAPIGLP